MPGFFKPVAKQHDNKRDNETALDMVLDQLFLTRQDLGINRPLQHGDSFLLQKVPMLLRNPAQLLPLANAWADIFADMQHSPSSLLAASADLTEMGNNNGALQEYVAVKEFAEFPKSALKQAVETVYQGLQQAQHVFDGAFAGLTQQELALVKRKLEDLLFVGQKAEALTRYENQLLTEKAFFLAAAVNRKDIVKAGQILATAVDRALEILNRKKPSKMAAQLLEKDKASGTSSNEFAVMTPLGQILIGGPGDNYYQGQMPLLLIELGGNDHYSFEKHSRFSVVIDCSGDDIYSSGEQSRLGAGMLGLGFLIDLAGDDLYHGENFAFGTGFLGVGLLWDSKGNDRYLSHMFSQGAGALGLGILFDGEGDDFYQGMLYSQGFGFVGGGGLLVDRQGNDTIVASRTVADHREASGAFQSYSQGFGLGCRDFAAGGLGILFNGEGDDTYEASYFSQGSSYWLAMGMLIDGKGEDRYIARRYSQGSGTHTTIGALIDQEGNDRYRSWAVSQGCGHDRSIGLLWDIQGDDRYSARWLCQGSGNASGRGLLIDEQGDDVYEAGNFGTQGGGRFDERRDAASLGVLIDRGGEDVFSDKARDRILWSSGRIGGGVDAAKGIPVIWQQPLQQSLARGSAATVAQKPPEAARDWSTLVVPELEGELMTEESWQAAAETLADQGPSIIPALLAYLEIKDVSVQRALEEVFKKLGKDHLESIHRIVEQEDITETKKAFLLYVLGDIGAYPSKQIFLACLQAEDSAVQAMAIRGLYKLKACPPREDAVVLADSENRDVRRYLALALQACHDREFIPIMVALLADEDFNVRYAASRALKLAGKKAVVPLEHFMEHQDLAPAIHAFVQDILAAIKAQAQEALL